MNNSSARRSPPTAAGARPRHSSPPARPAPGERAAQGRLRRRGPDRAQPLRRGSSCSPSARAARSDATGTSPRTPRGGGPRRAARADTARGGSADARRRGFTNREIAATLVISVKTAGVHVSHILRKLNAPNRVEAAAIAHRLFPPHGSGGASSRPDTRPIKASVGRAEITIGKRFKVVIMGRRT